jgi:hypothetical protein
MKRLASIAAGILLVPALSLAQPASQASAPASADQAAPAATADVLGEWEITTVSPVGENVNTVEFRKEGDALKAFAKGDRGELPYDSVALDGTKLTLVLTIDYQGQPMTITYAGTVADKSINGSADFGGLAMGTFSATRKDAAQK